MAFDKKHKYCITQDSLLTIEKAQLDSAETAFFQTYKTNKAALKAINTSSFPEKCAELPGIFKQNWFTILIAICVFVLSFYIECQSLIMKFSINKNDDYHSVLALYNTMHKTNVEDRLKKMTDHFNKLNELKTSQANTDEITKWATDKLNSTLSKAPIHYKLNEYKRILKENGMEELSNEISNIQNNISNATDMEKAMNHLISSINRT